MGAFTPLYTFLSQIFDYGNTAIEKRLIFYKRLTPLPEFDREREGIDLSKIIEKLNGLFGGDTTDQDQLVYVNHVLKGMLLESETLRKQAASNTKERFANSPDLNTELLNAIPEALDAHTSMSTQALNSEKVQRGIKDILLNNAGLYETLRAQAAG